MGWKFWLKKDLADQAAGSPGKHLARPRDLPQEVGSHLVVERNLDPDWVWSLKCTLRRQGDKKSVYDIRIFNRQTASEKGISVMDYASLDAHPELILYEGTYNKNNQDVHIESKTNETV